MVAFHKLSKLFIFVAERFDGAHIAERLFSHCCHLRLLLLLLLGQFPHLNTEDDCEQNDRNDRCKSDCCQYR